MYKKSLQLALLFFIALGCTGGRHDKDLFVDSPGEYSLNDSLVLKVSVDSALVKYAIYTTEGNVKVPMKYRFSDHHGWFFAFDRNGVFWVISGDIGNAYFEMNDYGEYIYRDIALLDHRGIPDFIKKEYPTFFEPHDELK